MKTTISSVFKTEIHSSYKYDKSVKEAKFIFKNKLKEVKIEHTVSNNSSGIFNLFNKYC